MSFASSTRRPSTRRAGGTLLTLAAVTTLAAACGDHRTPADPGSLESDPPVGAPPANAPPPATDVAPTPPGEPAANAPAPGSSSAAAPRFAFITGSPWGTVGTRLINTPVVRVMDDAGRPLPGVRVTFATAPGSGVVTSPEQLTDVRGIAAPDRWTLGTLAGRQTLTASAPGYATVSLTATAEPGPASRVAVVEGDGQTATVMSPLAVSPLVRVTDDYGNGIPRVEVRFTADRVEDSFVLSPYLRTDETGAVRAGRWYVGRRPGSYRLTATALPFSAAPFSATLSATAVAGPPALLRVLEGDGQTAPAGTTLAVAPAVYVTDACGNRLATPGIRVVFRTFVGSGTITGAEQLTDADGVARLGSWTLGPLQTSLEPTAQLLLAQAPAFQPNVSGATFRAVAK